MEKEEIWEHFLEYVENNIYKIHYNKSGSSCERKLPFWFMDFSLLSPLEFFVDPKNVDGRNNKPPAMRVRVDCYTKEITFPCTIKLFRLYCRKER